MPIPNSSGLTTANLNQATDNPSRARSDLALTIQKFRELLESVDKAGGIVKLDADAQIEIARLFKTGAGLKLEKAVGKGNVLSHTNTPETTLDVKAASGEAIKRVKIDASGHVVRVEKDNVASLSGPFYSPWSLSRYDVINRRAIGRARPSNYNSDILSWVPGLSKHLPSVYDYLKSLGTNTLLSRAEEEALANVEKARFITETARSPFAQGYITITTYYELTIKPYRGRYVYYKVT